MKPKILKPRRKYNRKKKTSPPIIQGNQQPQATEPTAEPKQSESPSLVESILAPFKSASPTIQAEASPQNINQNSGNDSSSPISTEAVAKLETVPDVIGEDATAPTAEPASSELTKDDVRNALAQIAFEEDDVREALVFLFDWIAEIRKRPHYKLSDRQARLMARPFFMLANSCWSRLMDFVPEWIVSKLNSIPGSAGAIATAAPIVGVKVFKDFQITQMEKLGLPAPTEEKKPTGEAPAIGPKPVQREHEMPYFVGATREGVPMGAGTIR